jgi:hypothetical protein
MLHEASHLMRRGTISHLTAMPFLVLRMSWSCKTRLWQTYVVLGAKIARGHPTHGMECIHVIEHSPRVLPRCGELGFEEKDHGWYGLSPTAGSREEVTARYACSRVWRLVMVSGHSEGRDANRRRGV